MSKVTNEDTVAVRNNENIISIDVLRKHFLENLKKTEKST